MDSFCTDSASSQGDPTVTWVTLGISPRRSPPQRAGHGATRWRRRLRRQNMARRMAMPVHVTVWDEAGTDSPSVVLVHGTMTWGAACFPEAAVIGSSRLPLAGDGPTRLRI